MEWSTPARLAVLVFITFTLDRILRNRIQRKGKPLPPGPTPLPFLGSALAVNAQQLWLTFAEWRVKYGDIMYIRLVDTDYIVLSCTSLATELLDRRSEIYSDRPSIIMAIAPYYDFNFALMRYGEKWRACRRIFQQTFRANAALRFRPMQLRRARELVSNIITDPTEYPDHFLTFSAAVLLSATYDHQPSPRNDSMVWNIDRFLRMGASGLAPLRVFIIRAFPFLLYVPDWFPGSWIKRAVRETYVWRNKMVETPYKDVKERMQHHVDISMLSDHINRMEGLNQSRRLEHNMAFKHAAASGLNGGTNTTVSTMMVFALAMVENPWVWKRAQAEIDNVVGPNRLPEFEDRVSLPYVDAIIREVLRWRPVLPLGGMHCVTQNDMFKGYFIPSGAVVLLNVWSISRDESRYPDADKFIPDRFLKADGKLTDDDPRDFVFGFGKRICPGRYLADASLWSAVVTMLATLDFNPARDADGNPIQFTPTFTQSGIIESPDPFPCVLSPRSNACELFDHVLPARE